MKHKSDELSRSDQHRKDIFADIKKGKPASNEAIKPEQIEREAQALLDNYVQDRPFALSNEPADELVRRITSGVVIGTTIERLDCTSLLPKAVEIFLDKHDLPNSILLQPSAPLTRLSWGDMGLLANLDQENSVSVCMADLGIAETGSVIIHSSETMPVLMNFLSTYQIITVRKSTVLRHLEDYSEIALRLFGPNKSPRNTTLITGASGTTDIEGELVQGAHGPRHVHIICLDDQ